MNKQIKFSEQWTKLEPKNRIVGKEFTTARGYEPRKQAYYEKSAHETFDVILKGEKIGEAWIYDVEYRWSHNLPLSFWKADTYAHYEWKDIWRLMTKFYNVSDPFLIVLYLEWTEVV